MSKLLPRHYAKILYQLTVDLPTTEIDNAVQNFLALLKRRRVLKKLPIIVREFTEYTEEQTGVEQLTITSARELSDKVIKKIAGAFGAETKVTTTVNPETLGGVVIRTRQAILDASVRTRLKQLHNSLVKNLS